MNEYESHNKIKYNAIIFLPAIFEFDVLSDNFNSSNSVSEIIGVPLL